MRSLLIHVRLGNGFRGSVLIRRLRAERARVATAGGPSVPATIRDEKPNPGGEP